MTDIKDKQIKSQKKHKKTRSEVLTGLSVAPTLIAPRFDSISLKNNLKICITKIECTPIQHYEIKLFKLTEHFHHYLGGIEFSISCIGSLHHLILLKNNPNLSEKEIRVMNAQIEECCNEDAYIFQKYKLLCKFLKLCGWLMVKWNIFKLNKYDFRYDGRPLNVKLLDLEKLNSTIFSMDILWFSFAIFDNPLVDLAESSLLEMAKILKDSFSRLFSHMIQLNGFNPNYKIKKTIAYKSLTYRKFVNSVIPEENIEKFYHQKLNLKKGFFANFFYSNPILEDLNEKLIEFESIFRTFEKELIMMLLRDSGANETFY